MHLGQLGPVWMHQELKTNNRKLWNSQSSLYVLLLFDFLLLNMVWATNWSFLHISVLILTSNAFFHPMDLTVKMDLKIAPFYCPYNQTLLSLAIWKLPTLSSYTQKLGEHLLPTHGHSVHFWMCTSSHCILGWSLNPLHICRYKGLGSAPPFYFNFSSFSS